MRRATPDHLTIIGLNGRPREGRIPLVRLSQIGASKVVVWYTKLEWQPVRKQLDPLTMRFAFLKAGEETRVSMAIVDHSTGCSVVALYDDTCPQTGFPLFPLPADGEFCMTLQSSQS